MAMDDWKSKALPNREFQSHGINRYEVPLHCTLNQMPRAVSFYARCLLSLTTPLVKIGLD